MIAPSTVPRASDLNLRKVGNSKEGTNHRADRMNCGIKWEDVCFSWQNMFKSFRVEDFYMGQCWWNIGGSFQCLFLYFFSLELVHCAWTNILWHSNLDPILQQPSGVQPAHSLPAANLSFTALFPGKRRKGGPGDRGEAEQSQHVSGRAITACYRCWSAHLVVSS